MNAHATTLAPSAVNNETATSVPTRPRSNVILRYLPATIRILMGLFLLITGLNGLLNFLPQPTPVLPAGAMAFIEALMKTGYMLQLIAITQTVVGAFLLTNRFVPLALALFAPFIVNSVAFHLFLEPSGRVPSAVFLVFELYLAWHYRAAFRPMLKAKVTP